MPALKHKQIDPLTPDRTDPCKKYLNLWFWRVLLWGEKLFEKKKKITEFQKNETKEHSCVCVHPCVVGGGGGGTFYFAVHVYPKQL